jgi:hypothetical protein
VKTSNQVALYPGTDSNPRHPKYEADVLTATPLLQFYLCMIKLNSDKPQMFLTVGGKFESSRLITYFAGAPKLLNTEYE